LISGQFKRITPQDSLGKLTYILQGTPFAVVVKVERSAQGAISEKLIGIANQMDFATHII